MMNSHQPKRRSLVERYFAFLERRSTFDRLLFHIVLAVCIGAALSIAIAVSQQFSVDTPLSDGSLHEGIVGTPRFVNPALAITRPDHDMVALLYEGVLDLDPTGELAPALAESVELETDGVTYTITLRQDQFFHDGTQVTADDVVFTYTLIQNPELKSPLRGNWEGATVAKTGDFTLVVQLAEPYQPFIENFTVGIMPAHIWAEQPTEQIPFSQYNTSPVGSGLYAVNDISFSETGLITSYELTPSPYTNVTPRISTITISFFANETDVLTALQDGIIDSTPSLSNETEVATVQTDGYRSISYPLPRTFALFYNQNRAPALRVESARNAISAAINRDTLVATVLNGFGIPTHTPVPAGFGTLQSTSTSPISEIATDASSTPEAILIAGGWTRNEDDEWVTDVDGDTVTLALELQTVNTPSFVATAEYLAGQLQSVDIPVTIERYEQSDLVQNVIRPRNFTTLLFGNDVGRGLDLYPFWHSSQREDPGLNITGYTNIDTDAYLTTLRTESDDDVRAEALNEFVTTITDEQPATFLYTPSFKYVMAEDVSLVIPERLSAPSDRFATIAQWHRGNESLWPFFID